MKKQTFFLKIVSLVVAVIATIPISAFAATGLTYHGRIIKPNNQPLEAASVFFDIQIRSPGAENCLLFQEAQTLNMTGSKGIFVITIGEGVRVGAGVDGGYSFNEVFGNRGVLTVPNCAFGPSYTPNPADGRKLVIQFNDGSGWQTLNPQNINYVPLAIEAMQVSGYSKDQLLRVADGVTATEFSAGDWTALWDLITGNSSLYMKNDGSGFAPTAAVDFNGQKIVDLADPTLAQDAATKNYVDTRLGARTVDMTGISNVAGDGKVLTWNMTLQKWEGALPVDASKLALAGGTMSGAIAMGTFKITDLGDPVAAQDASTKAYSDANLRGEALATPVGQAGKSIRWNAGNTAWEYFTPFTAADLTSGNIISSLGFTPLDKAGDTMTGLLILSADPSNVLGAATKQYVDAVSTAASGSYVRIDGTTALTADWDLNGLTVGGTRKIVGLADPTVADGAATKGYVDSAVSAVGTSANAYTDAAETSANTYSDIVAATAESNAKTYADGKLVTKNLAVPAPAQDGQSIRWNETAGNWEYFTASVSTGTVSNVSSANADIGVATGSTTPVLTLNSGTGANQIVKLNASAELPAVSGVNLTALNATNIASGTLADARLSSNVALTTNTLSQFAPTTSAQLAGVLNDETGSGLAVFGTSPTFTTNITSPMIVGGTAAASSLTYKTTSGVGAAGADHIFQVGNNGATEAMRILNSGNVGIGTATPGSPLSISKTYSVPTAASETTSHVSSSYAVNDSNVKYGIRSSANSYMAGALSAVTNIDANHAHANGTLNTLVNVNAVANAQSGTIANLYQFRGEAGSTGAITNRFGFHFADTTGAGTVGSQYAVYVSDLTKASANNFAIYTAGSTKSYFGGNVGIGTTTPTAKLHLAAGTAAANTAPLKLTAGVNLTAPEAGAIEFDGTNLFYTDSTNARRTVATGASSYSDGSTILASAGTNAAPSLSFSGDSNTGFFNSVADTISVTAGGATIFNISASGIVSPTAGGANITTAAGTASAPTFSFAGDTDTGWFRPAADTLAASTAGAERVRIDASGKVGIGVNSPTEKLHVGGQLLVDAPADPGSAVRINISSGGLGSAADVVGVDVNASMPPNSGTTYGVRSIVGLGTGQQTYGGYFKARSGASGVSNTAVYAELNSAGNTGLFSTTYALYGYANNDVSGTTATNYGMAAVTNNTSNSIAAILADGYTIAGVKNLVDISRGGSAVGAIKTTLSSTAYHVDSGNNYLSGAGSNSLTLNTNGAERMRIDSAGSVGIGTASPSAKLHVTGTGDSILNVTTTNLAGATGNVVNISAGMDNLGSDPVLLNLNGTTGNVPRGKLLNAANARYSFELHNGSDATGTVFNEISSGGFTHWLPDTTSYGETALQGIGVNSAAWFDGATPLSGSSINMNITGWGGSSPGYRQVYGVPVRIRAANPSSTSTAFYADVAEAANNWAFYAVNGKSFFGDSVGIGVTAPTAKLHLPAGTAAAATAPLKFTAGVSLTTPEDGAMEYNGSALSFTIGTTRYNIPLNASAGNFTNVTNISNAAGSITMTPAASSSVIIDQTTVSTSSTSGALVVNGGVGVAGRINAAGTSGDPATTGTAQNGSLRLGYSNHVLDFGNTTASPWGSWIQSVDKTNLGINYNLLLNPNGGNVGIGTMAPTVGLDVQAPTGIKVMSHQIKDSSSDLLFSSPGSFGFKADTDNNGGYGPVAKFYGSLDQEIMYVSEDGNVGLGTFSPNARLDMKSGASAIAPTAGNRGILIHSNMTTSYPVIEINNGTSPVLFVNNTGEMGLGTASPGAKLDVRGDSLINGLTLGRGVGNQTFNVALGVNVLTANTTGNWNTAVGLSALQFNTTGINNTAIGQSSLTANTTGTSNTAIGGALNGNTTGSANTALGTISLNANTTGDYNTSIGYQALFNKVTGGFNVALGSQAGLNLTSGNNNIAIGYLSNLPSATGSDQLNIGNTIYGDINFGKIGIGVTAPTAALQIKAGTAGLAPLKLTTGVNLTTPEAGAIEYDGTNLYFTDSGATRRTVATIGGSAYGAGSTILAAAGSAAAPSLSFNGDSNTGFFNSVADTISVTAGGATIFNMSAAGIVSPTAGGANITSAAGTAAAPTFSFAGDTDTGWYSPAANSLAAGTGGSERMRIDASGNVGIGTTAPAMRAEIASAITDSAYNGLRLTNTSFTQDGYNSLEFFNSHASANFASSRIYSQIGGGGLASKLRIAVADSSKNLQDRMVIDVAGNVGIGTASPSYKLEAIGDVGVSGTLYTPAINGGYSQTNPDGLLIYNAFNNINPYITLWGGLDASKVRINTNTKNIAPTVDDSWTIGSTTNRFNSVSVGTGTSSFAGNVGINTNAPAANEKLAVNLASGTGARIGPAANDGSVALFVNTASSAQGGLLVRGSAAQAADLLTVQDSAATNLMKITADGSVGIGTGAAAVGAKLDVVGRIRAAAPSGGVAVELTAPGAVFANLTNTAAPVGSKNTRLGNNNGAFVFEHVNDAYTVATERMRIQSGGNVGIGTSNPQDNLHIQTTDSRFGMRITDQTSGTGIQFQAYYPAMNLNNYFDGTDMRAIGTGYSGGVSLDPDVGVLSLAISPTSSVAGAVSTSVPVLQFDNTGKASFSGNVGIGVAPSAYQLELSTDSAAKPGTSTWTVTSDVRLKDVQGSFTRGLDAMLGIEPIYFNYKKDNVLKLPSDKTYVGIRAQDVAANVPEAVATDAKGFMHVTNDAIIWTMFNAIKELYQKWTDDSAVIHRELASVKEENAQLKEENSAIKSYLCSKDPAAPICK